MDLPLLKNGITKILRSQKPVIYSRYMQPSNSKMCMYCRLSRCHKSFRFAKVRLILLGYVKTVESTSRVEGDIGLKSLFLSSFTL